LSGPCSKSTINYPARPLTPEDVANQLLENKILQILNLKVSISQRPLSESLEVLQLRRSSEEIPTSHM